MTNAIPILKKRTSLDIAMEWGGYLLAIVLAVVLNIGIFARSVVHGHSMDSTLHDGQWLIATGAKLNPFVELKRGDIVIAESEVLDTVIVKRLIAVPGDTLEITGSRVYINGLELDEPYINGPMVTKDIPRFTLGADDYFLMGDNRNCSLDSRQIGCLDSRSILYVVYLDRQVQQLLLYLSLVALLLGASVWYANWCERREYLKIPD